jgi:hypothetical protein
MDSRYYLMIHIFPVRRIMFKSDRSVNNKHNNDGNKSTTIDSIKHQIYGKYKDSYKTINEDSINH